MTAIDVQNALQAYVRPEDALLLGRFFKTGEGQYSAGDEFIGVRVPQARIVCKQYKHLPLPEVQKLLDSPIHEYRLAALLILTYKYPQATPGEQKVLYDFYLANVYKGSVNNWDLVDSSAENIMGPYLLDKPRDILFELARSDDIWQRRVAILTAFEFIKKGDPSTTVELAEILLHDKQDLIQKAVGWMLREAGKRCEEKVLTDFLDKYAHEMPRTTLRYAVERLSTDQKQQYLQAKKTSNS